MRAARRTRVRHLTRRQIQLEAMVAARTHELEDSNVRLGALSSIDVTTVSQEPARLAEEALRLALSRAEGRSAGEASVVVPPRLVIRSTT